MTELVRGHGQIHVYVEHPIHEPILINGGNGVPLDLVVEPNYDDPLFVSDSYENSYSYFEDFNSSEPECPFDSYYNGKGYYCNSGSNFEDDDEFYDGNDDWDSHFQLVEVGRDGGSAGGKDGGGIGGGGMDGDWDEECYDGGDESGNGGARDAGDRNDDSDDEVEILGCRRLGKEPIVKKPQQNGVVTTDSNESFEDSDVEGARSMNPNQRYVSEDSASSDSDVVIHMHDQMGDGLMNSNYTTEELLRLTESSSNSEFKVAITEYAMKGGWGVKFVKNDKVRVRVKCQPPCKFAAYLAKMSREMSWQLKTLNLKHTFTSSYKNPRCSTKFLVKKLMKKVKRQLDIMLRDIQEVVHEKYIVNISAGKASKAMERAQEFVDGSYIEQYNQLGITM
nr:hypothetical protein CFP56_33061 [Quercus suber]